MHRDVKLAPESQGQDMFNRLVCLFNALLLLLAGCPTPTLLAQASSAETKVTSINAVQGVTDSSPLADSTVLVRGIVSGDFQHGDADTQRDLAGFFIQERVADANPLTSDGVFVFDGTAPATDVHVGDRVSVLGEVTEYFGETRINAVSVSVTGSGMITPTDIALPLPVRQNSDGKLIADLERYEGMLVRYIQPLTVSDLFNLERYGQVRLTAGGRQYAFTNQAAPDVSGYATHLQQLAAMSVVLDDGSYRQNLAPIQYLYPDPIRFPDYSIRIGDTVTGLSGNVRFSRGSGNSGDALYRIFPGDRPRFVNANPRQATPPVVGGNMKVASFNVLNFFTGIDRGRDVCGPAGNSGCRGADNVAEFHRQRQKLLTALTLMDDDIAGLIELENNASASLQSIVDGLNAQEARSHWSFIDTGTIGDDAIRVGFIYNSIRVSPLGPFAVLDGSVDKRFRDGKNRPILLQTFVQKSKHAIFSVAIAHLKSKGSSCSDIGDPDVGDGQGNCKATRRAAVQALVDWLATDPTASGDSDVVIIGDLNAYLKEQPLAVLQTAGYASLLEKKLSPVAYSFQFNGQSGALDHVLVSPSLVTQLNGVAEWHINADEPPVLDYNLDFGRAPSLFDADLPFRASDHDPVILGLTLDTN